MAKIWVLDTETKGTGAEMVPLERALEDKRSVPDRERASVVRRRPRRQRPEPRAPEAYQEPRARRVFRVVNAITGQSLANGADAREVVRLLDGMRSVADARVYVWEPDDAEWRPLTLREQKAIRDVRLA
ncbi:MAG TPA: hypothetical protein VHJ54_08870 [Solirubrobacterales bacterium]|jgi:hypothetical protein|nr:hypothetical protein [Solirubrobacterales bacterium]